MQIPKRAVVSLLLGGAFALPAHLRAAGPGDWPQFRGPGGIGVADASKLPVRWAAADNVVWKREIPGRGWSSPIVWRDRVYVTSAISDGTFKQPSTGIYGNDYSAELTKQGLPPEEVNKRVIARDIELADETGDITYVVYALDAKTKNSLREMSFASPAVGGDALYLRAATTLYKVAGR